jgi:protein gp37
MPTKTSIEWTDFTTNPLRYRDASGREVWACEKVSPGCKNCYSEAIAGRFKRGGPFNHAVTSTLTPYLDREELRRIVASRAISGKRVFPCDMTDLFGEWVSDEMIAALFGVFAARPDVTFQVLTKRAERLTLLAADAFKCLVRDELNRILERKMACYRWPEDEVPGPPHLWPLPNVWIGVSVEDKQRADERIPHLLRCPAAVRFLSVEPMLGPVDLSRWIARVEGCGACDESYPVAEAVRGERGTPQDKCARCGEEGFMISLWGENQINRWKDGKRYDEGGPEGCDDGPQLGWVIVGGESGPGARPMAIEWARAIVGQFKSVSVPVFVKQVGSMPCLSDALDGWPQHVEFRKDLPATNVIRLRARKGGDPEEWPADLRVREYPNV